MFYRLKFRAMASLLKNSGNVTEEQKLESANFTKDLASLSQIKSATVDRIAADVAVVKAAQAASVTEKDAMSQKLHTMEQQVGTLSQSLKQTTAAIASLVTSQSLQSQITELRVSMNSEIK
jgi:chromatin segregation and condensation protein Rec8/ScpA/Scc1 (kleisin family)